MSYAMIACREQNLCHYCLPHCYGNQVAIWTPNDLPPPRHWIHWHCTTVGKSGYLNAQQMRFHAFNLEIHVYHRAGNFGEVFNLATYKLGKDHQFILSLHAHV